MRKNCRNLSRKILDICTKRKICIDVLYLETWNNNVNWKHSFQLQTQFFMQAVISSWLNLDHFQTRKRNHIQHEWSLETFKIRGGLCSRNEKTLPMRKAPGSTIRSKQKEGQTENKILFNNPWVFDKFVLFPAIIMQYL